VRIKNFVLIALNAFILLSAGNMCFGGSDAKPLVFGASTSFEGKYAETSFMVQNAYKLWVEKVNLRGGILGRPVKLILYDDKSQEENVRSIYEKLIKEDRRYYVEAE
jgi:branched-chain amino acid transport system substrate-binding protein